MGLYPRRVLIPFFSRLRLPTALAAVLALAALPAGAHAAPLLGVQADGLDPETTAASVDRQLAAFSATHAKAMRLEVNWSQLEPLAPGQYDPRVLATLDHMVDGAAKRGIKVLLFIDRTPCWASSAPDRNGCAGTSPNLFDITRYGPTDPQTYVPVSTFLVSRYGSKLGAFEVWNEPDQANEKYWAGPDKVTRYVELMRAVYGPIKQANPALPVIAGSFVGTNGKWLKAMYAAGAKGLYDGLAVHFYDLPLQALKTTHAVQKANGDSAPLWLTEFGWTSCLRKGGPTFRADHPCVSPAAQARGVKDVLNVVRSTSWINAATLYTLHDQDDDYQFGLLDRAGRRKPVFAAAAASFGGSRSSLTRPTLRLRRSGRHVAASGSGSVADVYQVNVYQGTTLRYRVNLRTTGSGSYQVALPAVLGTSGLKVRISSLWSPGTATTRRN
jgi:hypothetical protein